MAVALPLSTATTAASTTATAILLLSLGQRLKRILQRDAVTPESIKSLEPEKFQQFLKDLFESYLKRFRFAVRVHGTSSCSPSVPIPVPYMDMKLNLFPYTIFVLYFFLFLHLMCLLYIYQPLSRTCSSHFSPNEKHNPTPNVRSSSQTPSTSQNMCTLTALPAEIPHPVPAEMVERVQRDVSPAYAAQVLHDSAATLHSLCDLARTFSLYYFFQQHITTAGCKKLFPPYHSNVYGSPQHLTSSRRAALYPLLPPRGPPPTPSRARVRTALRTFLEIRSGFREHLREFPALVPRRCHVDGPVSLS